MSDSAKRSTSMLEDFYDDYVRTGEAAWREDRVDRITALLQGADGCILDVGCGVGRNLRRISEVAPGARLYGTDISVAAVDAVRSLGYVAECADASGRIPFDDGSFDIVVCGEVIEHLIDPDGLLDELRRVLRPSGRLILTTPNLAYAVNRVLLLAGIQPIFTETSLFRNYGRYWPFLGQGRSTQGHLKIFTARAAHELMLDRGFVVERVIGYRFVQAGPIAVIDEMFRRLPGLAAGYIFDARSS